MKKKTTLILCVCLVVCLGLLWLLQALLMPKYMGKVKEGALIGEYYQNAGNNDVVFVGDCEVYENFSPITLWEKYGITSYIRGSAQQMIWQSYYLMEETFRYETPKVMVFNVLSMKYDTPHSTKDADQREAYNRMTLDGMRWSKSKWNAVKASMTDDEKAWEGQWSYVFPLLRYHDRWSELTKEDFQYLFKKEQVSDNGYLMQTGIKPFTDDYVERPLVDYTFGENSYYYLDKMVELCKSHGTQLVLIKAPSLSPVWWDEWDQQMVDYAEKHDLLYINLLEHQEEIGIDWSTDTYDAGLHLNVYGAEKLSAYFGKVLVEQCGVADHRNDAAISADWEEKRKLYYARFEELTTSTN